MSIYAFEPGPKYRPLTPQAAWDSALSQPLGLGANLLDQTGAGVMQSFGLGTTIRDTLIPQGNVERSPLQIVDALTPGIGMAKEAVRGLVQNYINPDQPSLTEDEWKASPSYRENIPYDPGMTEARAQALASWDDARKVREHFAAKRPFSSFVGNLAGQALDPINYVPVVSPLIRAAAVAKAGRVAGTAAIASVDAAANTALAAGVTYDQRGSYGDDVSWQGIISEIATAALIGGAFGTIGGAVGARSDARAVREATDRLSTLRATQEARIALNEAIDGIVSGEDIRLSPNATEPMARVAELVNPARRPDFLAPVTREDLYRSTAVGRVVDSRPVALQDFEKLARDQILSSDPVLATQYTDAQTKFERAQESVAAIEEPLAARRQSDAVALVDQPSADRLKAIETEMDAKPNAKRRLALEAERDSIVQSIGPDAVAKAENDFRIGPAKQAKRARAALATARQEFAKVRRQVDDRVAQSDNIRALQSRVAVDTSPARPDPIPEGRAKAEAALAKAETYKATAEQHRVDPETGSYVEEAEIKQLDIEGRLTEQDKADLEAAAQIHENGVAYGDALKAAVNCLI